MKCLSLALLLLLAGRSLAHAEDGIDFTRDIRPLLAANCFACHGADEASREADLRLDVRDQAIADRGGTPAIASGSSAKSEVYRRLTTDDPDLRMPPADSGHTLTDAQIELIRQWIDAGAEYAEHWAFVPPRRPQPPTVKQADWPRNGVDPFILAKLEAAGLAPNPEADRYTLIRRLSLDLTGTPPTVEEVEAFVNDASPTAYEAVVDRLLASHRFAEHWARMWMDLARYADTKGYEKDQPRQMWRYRDWVIGALHADLPFDQFTLEQLAGDLLPGATTDQTLATAFHRNTMSNDEGGTDNEEFRVAAVKDRVDTTMQVWMGLTMGCAKCHSHKYDPITHHDYYRFYAIFNQTEDADRPDDAPRLPTPTAEQQARMDDLNARLAQVRREYRREGPEFAAAYRAWEQELATQRVWTPLAPSSAASAGGAVLTVQPDASVLASGAAPEKDVYTLVADCALDTVTAIRLEALTDPSLDKSGPGRNGSDPNFVVSEFTVALQRPDGAEQRLTLTRPRADFSQNGWPVENAIDGKPETGWAVSPQLGKPHVAVFDLVEPLTGAAGGKLTIALSQQYGNRLVLGKLRLSVADAEPATLAPRITTVEELAALAPKRRTPQQQEQLREAFRQVYPATAELGKQLAALEAEKTELQKQIPNTPVMRELPEAKQRTTKIHVRGNFLEPGEEVQPGLPEAFGDFPDGAPRNRLGVARWLTHPDNPLTARVMVNRLWARLFGVGLVETEEDFGTQGSLPSHPALLDWLALEFRETHRWSIKQTLKTMVMSAAYRQTSHVTPQKIELDPQNRLLSRSPRFRLSAEAIRDQALAAAGLLSSKIGGPSVMPPQPAGLWRTTYSTLRWETSPGEDRYRRALYTFLRRTSPYPSMLTFDAGSGEVCLIRRVRTNTPLQALVTLNDPVYIEAAGALAQRALTQATAAEKAASSKAVAAVAFRRALVRPPSEVETGRLVAMYEEALAEFQQHPERAAELLEAANTAAPAGSAPAELAAWTVVGNVLLNLDEALMRN